MSFFPAAVILDSGCMQFAYERMGGGERFKLLEEMKDIQKKMGVSDDVIVNKLG